MSARSHSWRPTRAARLPLLTIALIMGLFILGGGTPALAQPATSSAGAYNAVVSPPLLQAQLVPSVIDVDTPPSKDDAERSIYDSQYRSINRWGDATTSFFTKYDGFVGTQLIDQAQRGVMQSMQMSVGNFLNSATSNATQWAVSFNAIDALGANIDDITGQVVRALFTADGTGGVVTTSLIAGVLVILILSMVWQSIRQGGVALLIRRLAGLVVVFGMIFAMANASLSGGGRTDDKGYHPVPLSPGWVVKSVNDGVGQIANTPADLFVKGMQTLAAGKVDAVEGGSLSCAAFQKAMVARLKSQQSDASNAGSGGLVAITTVMDSLWETTGLSTWKQIQTGFNNPYGEDVYCRILEDRSSVSTPLWSSYLTASGAGSNWMIPVVGAHKGENAPFAPDTPSNTAATYVAWAACEPTGVNGNKITWKWADGWVGFKGGVGGAFGSGAGALAPDNAQSNCDSWWNAVSSGGADQDIPNVFDISGESGWIDDRTKGVDDAHRDQVRDFLYALAGVNATGGATATWSYATSSGLQFAAFGFLDVMTFLAKLFCAMFAFTLWFVLIGALFTRNPFKDRILRAFNRFLGVTIFASMMTAIMTFVVIFTRILIGLGNGMFGPGSVFAMLWAGFAPIAALILVHLLFTKVFRMPSPVSINGARAWHKAGASGAMGAAAGAGIGAGIANAIGSRAKTEGRKAGAAALHKASGGRLGTPYSGQSRRSNMGAAARREALDDKQDLKAESMTPRQARKQVTELRKKELSDARAWHKESTGQVAPGDFRGALETAGHRAAQRSRDLAKQAQDKVVATPLAKELHHRADYRKQLREARTGEDLAALQALREEQKQKVGAATAKIAAIMDSPAATTNRARLGVEQTAQKVWNSPKVVGARSDAAIIAGNTRAAVNYVKQSDLGRTSAVVSHYAAKPVRVAARGATAVVKRSQNNAAVIEQYRAAMAAKAALKKPSNVHDVGARVPARISSPS